MNLSNYTTYPMAYPQPMYANNYIPQQQAKMPNISYGMNWVQGIEGAKAAQMPINTTAPFFDSEQNKVYIKTADNIGMTTMKIFRLEEETEQKPSSKQDIDLSQYVTKQELQDKLDNAFKMAVEGKFGGKQDEFVSTTEPTTTKSKSK